MEKIYLKLNAKRKIMKSCMKYFFVSIFPFISIFILTGLNYYLLILLNQTKFNMYISPYAEYIGLSLMMVTIILSFFVWRGVRLCADSYFFIKSLNKKITFSEVIKCISFRQCFTFSLVSIIKFLLTVSWCAFYLFPCIAVSLLLLYSYKYQNNGFNINLTLFISSIALLVIGVIFLYVTLKRYSMCSSVVLTEDEKNPIKIIEKSISIMEGHSIEYSFYCLSFAGWILSCILIIPAFYVLPYIAMGKWCFKNSLGVKKILKKEKEKPIIFYINKRVES